jgi:hypothetical protein
LCSWSEAVEYFAGPFVQQPEYERITRNYAPVNSGARFTACRPENARAAFYNSGEDTALLWHWRGIDPTGR